MRLDWAAMMRAGIGGLKLKPQEFWALTPAELRLMLGPLGPAPMGRARFDELCRDYPDEETA
ncbi:rcc01693 family protein [Limimaricola litoreus]|uniref:Phage tail assembly chaperone n=1 Tax=Limimaricola litoreus TaxID=2955316 RepID=A0A9X2JQS0_9RHOB|nr:rcc01693 family protein [Limimaricola litoreus]MCP1167896.1 phage tail assembly chaperone [Limimaricola litoreus]